MAGTKAISTINGLEAPIVRKSAWCSQNEPKVRRGLALRRLCL